MGNDVFWTCKIGPANRDKLPDGADHPLRQAVIHAFGQLVGEDAFTVSSGWGRNSCDEPEHSEPFACSRKAEGGFVCESTLLLEQEGARLGMATTEELLRELEARGSMTEADDAIGKYLEIESRVLRGTLTPEMLSYRTVDA